MTRLLETYKRNEILTSLISYLLVACMMFCLGVTAANMVRLFIPASDFAYLPYFCFFTSLLGVYSQRKLSHTSELDANPLVYRLVEWIVLLVVLKLIIYIWNGIAQIFGDLAGWQQNFIETFFTGEYILSVIVVAMVWSLTLMFVGDLIELEGDVNILQARSQDMLVSDRGQTQERMANRVIMTGIGLVIIATLSRLDYESLPSGLKLASQNQLNILAYFLLGLVLLSLTQLATRRASWAWEHIPVGDGIVRNWVLFSLIFLGVLSLTAFVLPTGYTLGFLPTLRYFLGMLFGLIYSLVLLVIVPIFLFIAWLLSLVGVGNGEDTPMEMPQQILPQMPEEIASAPSPFLVILKAVLFWGFLVVIVVYAFSMYIRQNQDLVKKLKRMPGLAWLVKAWRWIVARVRLDIGGLPKTLGGTIARLFAGLRKEPDQPKGGYISLRKLDPRRQILFYYYTLLRRSAEIGLPRQPWQTPSQFADSLKSQLPASEPEIETMTQVFEEARYSTHVVTADLAGKIRQAWAQLRKIFNGLKKGIPR